MLRGKTIVGINHTHGTNKQGKIYDGYQVQTLADFDARAESIGQRASEDWVDAPMFLGALNGRTFDNSLIGLKVKIEYQKGTNFIDNFYFLDDLAIKSK